MGVYRKYIREYATTRKTDLSLLYSKPSVLKKLAADMAAPFVKKRITKVLAIEASGFVLGTAVALALGSGVVMIRKEGRTSWKTRRVSTKDYSGATSRLELITGVLSKKDRVLVVDDWSETGGQMLGAIRLAEQSGATVIGATAVNMDDKALKNKVLSKYILHYVEHYR